MAMIKWMVMMILSENIENRFAHRASGVEDLEHALLAVDLDLLPVGVLDGGVVLLHEDALHKLHCQGRLPHTTRTQHHDLVFPHPGVDWPGTFALKVTNYLHWKYSQIKSTLLVVC